MSVPVTEYWLISAPGEKTPQNTFERLNQATKAGGDKLSENFKFNIPDLKVGTLDVLVALSDDLNKIDVYTESIVRKIAATLEDVLESSAKGNLNENLRIGGDSNNPSRGSFKYFNGWRVQFPGVVHFSKLVETSSTSKAVSQNAQ